VIVCRVSETCSIRVCINANVVSTSRVRYHFYYYCCCCCCITCGSVGYFIKRPSWIFVRVYVGAETHCCAARVRTVERCKAHFVQTTFRSDVHDIRRRGFIVRVTYIVHDDGNANNNTVDLRISCTRTAHIVEINLSR